MIINYPVYHDMNHQIRDQHILIRQIKEDYKECKKRWEQVEKGIIDISEAERILKIIAWINTELTESKKMQGSTIEGTCWGETNNIEKEISMIQEKIRIKIRGYFECNETYREII